MTNGTITVIAGELVHALQEGHDVAVAALLHAVLDQIRQLNHLAHRCSMPFSVRDRCGHCRQTADLAFVSTQEYAARNPQPPPRPGEYVEPRMRMSVLGEEDTIDAYGVGICPFCGKPSLIFFKTKRRTMPNIQLALGNGPSLMGGSSVISVTAAYPDPPAPDTHTSWPSQAADLFRDAQLMLEEGRSPAIIISTCRSVLDVATRALGGTEKILAKRIDELRQKGVITESLTRWAHELRIDGNAAVHEIEGTAETASDLVAFLRVFMQVGFTLPAEIEAKRARSNSSS